MTKPMRATEALDKALRDAGIRSGTSAWYAFEAGWAAHADFVGLPPGSALVTVETLAEALKTRYSHRLLPHPDCEWRQDATTIIEALRDE